MINKILSMILKSFKKETNYPYVKVVCNSILFQGGFLNFKDKCSPKVITLVVDRILLFHLNCEFFDCLQLLKENS